MFDYYKKFMLPRHASCNEISQLLEVHMEKLNYSLEPNIPEEKRLQAKSDIAILQKAYSILVDPILRKKYDDDLARSIVEQSLIDQVEIDIRNEDRKIVCEKFEHIIKSCLRDGRLHVAQLYFKQAHESNINSVTLFRLQLELAITTHKYNKISSILNSIVIMYFGKTNNLINILFFLLEECHEVELSQIRIIAESLRQCPLVSEIQLQILIHFYLLCDSEIDFLIADGYIEIAIKHWEEHTNTFKEWLIARIINYAQEFSWGNLYNRLDKISRIMKNIQTLVPKNSIIKYNYSDNCISLISKIYFYVWFYIYSKL